MPCRPAPSAAMLESWPVRDRGRAGVVVLWSARHRGGSIGGSLAPVFRIAGGLAIIVLVMAGCAPPTSPAGSNDGGVTVGTPPAAANAPVDVALVDTAGANGPMALTPFADSAPAGDVTFSVKNLGTIEHEMIVLKTDTPFDQFPITDSGDPPAPVTQRGRQGRRDATMSARRAIRTCSRARRERSRSRTGRGQLRAGVQPRQALRLGMRAPFTVTPAGSSRRSSGAAAVTPGTVR